MNTLDTVLETASGFAETVVLLSNELVLGLGVAVGLIVWLVAGHKGDDADTNHRPRHL